MRVLGLPLDTPQTVLARAAADIAAVARIARSAPAQLDRLLELGEEIARVGNSALPIGERLDDRAEAILTLGERLDERTDAILALGKRLDSRAADLIELGNGIRELVKRVDARGAEIVEGADRVAQSGDELIAVLPAFERAVQMATPLEGAIDRFGRLVDMLPGGAARRRGEEPAPDEAAARTRADEPGDAQRTQSPEQSDGGQVSR